MLEEQFTKTFGIVALFALIFGVAIVVSLIGIYFSSKKKLDLMSERKKFWWTLFFGKESPCPSIGGGFPGIVWIILPTILVGIVALIVCQI